VCDVDTQVKLGSQRAQYRDTARPGFVCHTTRRRCHKPRSVNTGTILPRHQMSIGTRVSTQIGNSADSSRPCLPVHHINVHSKHQHVPTTDNYAERAELKPLGAQSKHQQIRGHKYHIPNFQHHPSNIHSPQTPVQSTSNITCRCILPLSLLPIVLGILQQAAAPHYARVLNQLRSQRNGPATPSTCCRTHRQVTSAAVLPLGCCHYNASVINHTAAVMACGSSVCRPHIILGVLQLACYPDLKTAAALHCSTLLAEKPRSSELMI
jgi:hypothetical protein